MDALSHVLRAVELSGAVFLDAEFRDPWCILVRGVLLLAPRAEARDDPLRQEHRPEQ